MCKKKESEVNSISETRYIGKVCDKHPELKGERLKRDYQCPACRNEKKKVKRVLINSIRNFEKIMDIIDRVNGRLEI